MCEFGSSGLACRQRQNKVYGYGNLMASMLFDHGVFDLASTTSNHRQWQRGTNGFQFDWEEL
jgi:hypothetical protein